jgi:hypothetical protein
VFAEILAFYVEIVGRDVYRGLRDVARRPTIAVERG